MTLSQFNFELSLRGLLLGLMAVSAGGSVREDEYNAPMLLVQLILGRYSLGKMYWLPIYNLIRLSYMQSFPVTHNCIDRESCTFITRGMDEWRDPRTS